MQKIDKIAMGSPPTGAPNASGVGKNCIFPPVEKSPAQMPYWRKFVSIRHGGLRPWQWAGRGIWGVINNSGGSLKFVDHSHGPVDINEVGCTKSADDMHSIACTLQRCVYKGS